jgi:hypothetical protein
MPSQLTQATLRILICGGAWPERNRIRQLLSNNNYHGSHAHTNTVGETLTMMRAGCFGAARINL